MSFFAMDWCTETLRCIDSYQQYTILYALVSGRIPWRPRRLSSDGKRECLVEIGLRQPGLEVLGVRPSLRVEIFQHFFSKSPEKISDGFLRLESPVKISVTNLRRPIFLGAGAVTWDLI